MDIENKLKVNRDSQPFKWVKEMTYKVGQHVLTPENREDEINALIMLTCFHLMQDFQRDPQTMTGEEILRKTSDYLLDLICLYCQLYLTKKGVEFTQEIYSSVQGKVVASKIIENFGIILMDRISGNKTNYDLFSSIDCLSFNSSVEPKFIADICAEFIPFKQNVENIEELVPGMDVCGCTLVSLVSKTDMSEIWKGKYNSRDVAIKLENFELSGKKLNKLLDGRSFEKIIQYIKETDEEFLAFERLKDFPYKVDNISVKYYNPLNKKVKIMSWLEDSVDKVPVENKVEFIRNMSQIIYTLHKSGFVFNNISPHHIMFKLPTDKTNHHKKIKLIDYKNLVEIKGQDKPHEDTYRSLALLSGTTMVTPYDDIESLFFVINTLISGEISYSDINDERNKKTQLTCFPYLISESIIKLRTLRQNDIYANNAEQHPNIIEYIDNIYVKGITSQTGEIIPGIVKIITDFISSYKEIPDAINIKLTRSEFATLKNIRAQFASDHRFSHIITNVSKFNDISLKILNFMNTSCEYEAEDQVIINEFLSG